MGDDRFEDRKSEVFSKAVRAGKRTYFFDVKETRNRDQYLTITESKKSVTDENVSYEKHKIFLYKEDFEKFLHGFQEACEFINDPSSNEEPEAVLDDYGYNTINS